MAQSPPIDAGPDQIICLGDYVMINVINPLSATLSWSPTLPTLQTQTFTPTQNETYTVTADYFGCISTDEITISIANPPNVNFRGDVLSGSEPHGVNFSNLTPSLKNGSSCEWIINDQTILGCDSVFLYL